MKKKLLMRVFSTFLCLSLVFSNSAITTFAMDNTNNYSIENTNSTLNENKLNNNDFINDLSNENNDATFSNGEISNNSISENDTSNDMILLEEYLDEEITLDELVDNFDDETDISDEIIDVDEEIVMALASSAPSVSSAKDVTENTDKHLVSSEGKTWSIDSYNGSSGTLIEHTLKWIKNGYTNTENTTSYLCGKNKYLDCLNETTYGGKRNITISFSKLQAIGYGAFAGNSTYSSYYKNSSSPSSELVPKLHNLLISVGFNDTKKTLNYIGSYAFYDCDGLLIADLSDATNLKQINAYAFGDCNALKYVILPDNVTSISSSAFPNRSTTYLVCKQNSTTMNTLINSGYSYIATYTSSYSVNGSNVSGTQTLKYTVTTSKTGNGSITSSQTVFPNTVCTIGITPTSGYKITNILKDGVSQSLPSEGNSINISFSASDMRKNHTVSATFDAREFVITWNGNGGTSTMASTKVKYGSNIGTVPTANKTGYIFSQWNTNQNGNGSVISATTIYSTVGNSTYYAQYKPKTFSVYYNANDGINGVIKNTSVTYDSPYGEMPTPTRNGYDFEGWFTNSVDGTKVTPTTIYKTDGNTTLYAHWEKGGGKPDPNPPQPPVDENDYYINLHYSAEKGSVKYNGSIIGGNYQFDKDGTYRINVSTTSDRYVKLYADGELVVNEITASSFDYSFTLTKETPKTNIVISFPKKDGSDDDSRDPSSGEPSDEPNEDENIVINVAENNIYIVNLNKTYYIETSGMNCKISDLFNAKYNNETLTSLTLVEPKNLGNKYSYKMFIDDNGNTVKTTKNLLDYPNNSRFKLIVEKNKKGTVTYSLNGGTLKVDVASKMPKNYDKDYKLPKPTRQGYVFMGWYVPTAYGDIKIDKLSKNDELCTGNITLIAKWYKKDTSVKGVSPLATTKINYDLDGGSFTDKQKTKVKYSIEGNKAVSLLKPTKDGYKFVGWFVDDTKVTKLAYNKSSCYGKRNVTVKAMWQPKSYTIKFGKVNGKTMNNIKTYYSLPTYLENCSLTMPNCKFTNYTMKISKTESINIKDNNFVLNLNAKGKNVTLKPNFEYADSNINGGIITMENNDILTVSENLLSNNTISENKIILDENMSDNEIVINNETNNISDKTISENTISLDTVSDNDITMSETVSENNI